MPLMMFGIPGMAMGAGLGLGVEKLGFNMTAGRYVAGATAGGLVLGPDTYGTRKGARYGMAAGGVGALGYDVFKNYDRMSTAFVGAAGSAGAAANEASGIVGFGMRHGILNNSKSVDKALATLSAEGGLAETVLSKVAGLRGVSQEVGSLSRFAGKSLIKGGAYGAIIGGGVLGALTLARGGAHIKSNQPVY